VRRLLKDRIVPGGIIALIVAWIATIHIGAAFAQDSPEAEPEGSGACDVPTNAKPLSACLGPNFPPGGDVVIGQGATGEGNQCNIQFVDSSRTGPKALGKITINKWGFLYVPDSTVEIETAGIDVSGLFQAGTARCPIGKSNPKNKVTITFTGPRPCPSPQQCDDKTHKGIEVQDNGRLSLFGARGVPGGSPDGVSWTHLSEAAGPPAKYGAGNGVDRPVPAGGDRTIQLAKDVATGTGAWQEP